MIYLWIRTAAVVLDAASKEDLLVMMVPTFEDLFARFTADSGPARPRRSSKQASTVHATTFKSSAVHPETLVSRDAVSAVSRTTRSNNKLLLTVTPGFF